MRRGSNVAHVSAFNDSVLLDSIRRAPEGTSRAELRAASGLSPQTVSDVCARLLERGLIAETGTRAAGVGRPRRTVSLVPTSRYALGVHLDPAGIIAVLLDLAGNLVARLDRDVQGGERPDAVVAEITAMVRELVERSGIDRGRLIGLGIAAPGPMESNSGVLVDPPHLPGWHRVPLRAQLQEATGLPVGLWKEVVAGAVAEKWAGSAREDSSFVFLFMGSGIGAGVITSDISLRGVSGNAGSIGHFLVDSTGPLCACGSRGCLGVVSSPLNIISEAVAVGAIVARPNDGELVSALRRIGEVAAAADSGHGGARAVLERAALRVGRGLDAVVSLLDVGRVICGGSAWTSAAHHYVPIIQHALDTQFPHRAIHGITVSSASFGDDVAAVGAACIVLDDRFAASPGTFMVA